MADELGTTRHEHVEIIGEAQWRRKASRFIDQFMGTLLPKRQSQAHNELMKPSGYIDDQNVTAAPSRVQPGEDRAEPHALANELTDEPVLMAREGEVNNTDPALRSPGERRIPRERDRALTTTQKDVGRQMMMVIGGIVAAGLVLAAVVTRQWLLLGLGLLMIIPFMILVSAPFWLATTTKAAQDDKVREQRGRDFPAPPPQV